MFTTRGRFDPGSTVQLVLAPVGQRGISEAWRPEPVVTIIETATADASGTATFANDAPRDPEAYRRSTLWLVGFSGGQPLQYRAVTDTSGTAQPPILPDRSWTPRAPARASTSGGAS